MAGNIKIKIKNFCKKWKEPTILLTTFNNNVTYTNLFVVMGVILFLVYFCMAILFKNSKVNLFAILLFLIYIIIMYLITIFRYKFSPKFAFKFNEEINDIKKFHSNKIGELNFIWKRGVGVIVLYFILVFITMFIIPYLQDISTWVYLFATFFIIIKLLIIDKIGNFYSIIKNDYNYLHYSLFFFPLLDFFLLTLYYYSKTNLTASFVDMVFNNKEFVLPIIFFILGIIIYISYNRAPFEEYLKRLNKNYFSLLKGYGIFMAAYMLFTLQLILLGVPKINDFVVKIYIIKEIFLSLAFYYILILSYNILCKIEKYLPELDLGKRKILGHLTIIKQEKFFNLSFNNKTHYLKLDDNSYLDPEILNPILIQTNKYFPNEEIRIYGIRYKNEIIMDSDLRKFDLIIPVKIEVITPSKLRKLFAKDY